MEVTGEAEPVMVTLAFNVSATDTARVYEVTKVVLAGRGALEADITHRLLDEHGVPVIGECLKALMEESINALGMATGAVIGELECYAELLEDQPTLQPGAIEPS